MPIFRNKTYVELELSRLFKLLRTYEPDSDEYAATVDKIAKLHKLETDEQSRRVSPDTLALIGANLLGIVMILKHEELNVITTKTMGLLMRAR
jgi:hypothetical protein